MKYFQRANSKIWIFVAPLVGAWIEIKSSIEFVSCIESLPSWERGLKLLHPVHLLVPDLVAPLVGAWIEILFDLYFLPLHHVAPLVGAWIEIMQACLKKAIPSVAPLVGAWIEIRWIRKGV